MKSVLISSHDFDINSCDNIKILNDYMKNSDIEVDYCGISSKNDFYNYENIIQFKYKIINPKPQFSKICDFITDYKSNLNYDWYIKIRPDIKLLENINFDILSNNAINARARVYNGPAKIKYGMSVNGEGGFKNIGDCHYASREQNIILDDMFYIFHKNVIQKNAFNKIELNGYENEWKHTQIFNDRNIPLNVIGIYLYFVKWKTFSGNINI
jgi:hypothetical protein